MLVTKRSMEATESCSPQGFTTAQVGAAAEWTERIRRETSGKEMFRRTLMELIEKVSWRQNIALALM